jgi:hypothetical protein
LKRILTLAATALVTLSFTATADAQIRRAPKRPAKTPTEMKAFDPAPNAFRRKRAAEAVEASMSAPVTAEASLAAEAAAATPVMTPAPAAIPAPVVDQTAAAQAALTRLIGELQAGGPDYTRLEQRIADAMRGQQAALSGLIKSKGALQAVDSLGPDASGAQRFRARFATDSTDFGLSLNAQGQISGFTITD